MANRAKAGGELGMNGEHYAGGTFLPSTRLPKQGAQGRQARSNRALVEPGRLDVVPEGKKAIFATINSISLVLDGQRVPLPENHPFWTSVPGYRDEVVALCAAYNAGERFYV